MVNDHMRRLSIAALVFVMLAAQAASARLIVKAKSLACGGTGPQSGTISVTERAGVLTLKVRAQDLVAGQAATCGYTCGMVFTSGPEVPCGTVSTKGKLSSKIELPFALCFGFVPFFNTPTTGKCVASTVP